jgi:hypothetical protein
LIFQFITRQTAGQTVGSRSDCGSAGLLICEKAARATGLQACRSFLDLSLLKLYSICHLTFSSFFLCKPYVYCCNFYEKNEFTDVKRSNVSEAGAKAWRHGERKVFPEVAWKVRLPWLSNFCKKRKLFDCRGSQTVVNLTPLGKEPP